MGTLPGSLQMSGINGVSSPGDPAFRRGADEAHAPTALVKFGPRLPPSAPEPTTFPAALAPSSGTLCVDTDTDIVRPPGECMPRGFTTAAAEIR